MRRRKKWHEIDVPGGSVGWTFSNIDYIGQSGSAPATINPVADNV